MIAISKDHGPCLSLLLECGAVMSVSAPWVAKKTVCHTVTHTHTHTHRLRSVRDHHQLIPTLTNKNVWSVWIIQRVSPFCRANTSVCATAARSQTISSLAAQHASVRCADVIYWIYASRYRIIGNIFIYFILALNIWYLQRYLFFIYEREYNTVLEYSCVSVQCNTLITTVIIPQVVTCSHAQLCSSCDIQWCNRLIDTRRMCTWNTGMMGNGTWIEGMCDMYECR